MQTLLGTSDGLAGGLQIEEKQKTPTKPANTTPWLVWETYFSQAEAFRDNIPKSLEDACPTFCIGCYGEG